MTHVQFKGLKQFDELIQYTFVIEDENNNTYTYHEVIDDNGDVEEQILVDKYGHEIYDGALVTWAEGVCK